MSVKIIKAIMAILEDEEANEGKKTADVAEAIFKEVEALINERNSNLENKRRIAVVGQIQSAHADGPFPVVLGPYTAVGKLDTQEAWNKAAQSHTTSRNDAGKLAWDTTVKTGRGQYMLAPFFKNAQEAWEFYRVAKPDVEDEILEIFSTIRGSSINIGPVCVCGMRGATCHAHLEGRL